MDSYLLYAAQSYQSVVNAQLRIDALKAAQPLPPSPEVQRAITVARGVRKSLGQFAIIEDIAINDETRRVRVLYWPAGSMFKNSIEFPLGQMLRDGEESA